MHTIAEKFPSPSYFLGSLVADRAPETLAVKLFDAYAEIRHTLGDAELGQWCLQIYWHLLRHGYQQSAMTMIAYPSDHDTERYELLASELLERRKDG